MIESPWPGWVTTYWKVHCGRGEAMVRAGVGENSDEPEAAADEADEHGDHPGADAEAEAAAERDHEHPDDHHEDPAGDRERQPRRRARA